MGNILLDPSWLEHLSEEFSKPYMESLRSFLQGQKASGKVIYPRSSEYFAAMDATPFSKVKVVILGQDPYHNPSQAHGLSFSVNKKVSPPPTLLNIFKEVSNDLSLPNQLVHGCLDHWANQGVLLMNSVLTVERYRAGSHQGKGWEIFTDRVVESLSSKKEHCVFLLWGAYAQKKGRFIDETKHCVLKTSHPSPLSAYKGFIGCKHFSRCNDYLSSCEKSPIDWAIV
ncbi:MAG: uracil-DNA glycosylase [Candidatus Azotimanducaceae bacterium]|uniref:Uracil-DNA glycosylase n=1 Tax=OM182 bacterium TaxID=2510334 RepID=A0A520S1H0_9GAMM|nr:MAG: uracil-DNA glycosylase [OM182 bacterium]